MSPTFVVRARQAVQDNRNLAGMLPLKENNRFSIRPRGQPLLPGTSNYGSCLHSGSSLCVLVCLSVCVRLCLRFFVDDFSKAIAAAPLWWSSSFPQAAVSGADPIKAGGLRGCFVGTSAFGPQLGGVTCGLPRIQRNWRRHSEYHKVVTMRTPQAVVYHRSESKS